MRKPAVKWSEPGELQRECENIYPGGTSGKLAFLLRGLYTSRKAESWGRVKRKDP